MALPPRGGHESPKDRTVAVAVISGIFVLLAAVIPLWLTGTIGGSGGDGGGRPTPSVSPTISPPSFAEVHIFLSKESAPGGATVLVSGEGFDPSESVTIMVQTETVATTHVDSGGKFSNVAIIIPRDLSKFAPQQFPVVATGASSAKFAMAPIEVSG